MKQEKTLTELLIEYNNITLDLEDLKNPNSKIVEAKVSEIWGDKPKGLTDDQKQQLNNILKMI